MGSPPSIPTGFSQRVWKGPSNNLAQPEFLPAVVCCTQISRHSLSYCLQRGQSLQKVLFLTPTLASVESWTQFVQTNNAEKNLVIVSKMIQNLPLKNPYPLEGWHFPFLKKTASPHFFFKKVQISWKASVMCFNYKTMSIVQTPVRSAPSWYSPNMNTQISSPVKVSGKTCLQRVKFAGSDPLQKVSFFPEIFCASLSKKCHRISKWNFAGHWSRMWASSFGYFWKSETTYLFNLEKLLPSKAVSQETFMTAYNLQTRYIYVPGIA